MLTPLEVAPYLQAQGLLQPHTVVAGDLTIADATRRNANFQVISESSPSYLLKQGVGAERVATVAHEAALYQWFTDAPAARPLQSYLPRYYRYDADTQVLVLELWPGAQTLGAYHARRGRFSVGVAGALGQALAVLHRLRGGGDLAGLPPCPPPWILSVQRPTLALYRDLSAANLQLIQTIQQFPDLGHHLDALHAEWRPETLTHYDIKGDNVLIVGGLDGRHPGVKLVDWEAAGRGDPCWDTGAVFGDYLSCWLLSIPLMSGAPPDRFLDLARYPLVKIQPALRRFWQAYRHHLRLDPPTAQAWLLRAVRYSAARLIQTAIEQGQTAAQLTGNALAFLQLSFNILQRPQDAAIYLLGIPW